MRNATSRGVATGSYQACIDGGLVSPGMQDISVIICFCTLWMSILFNELLAL